MRAVVVREKTGPDAAVLEDGVPESEGAHPMSPGEPWLEEVRALTEGKARRSDRGRRGPR
jgi:hypothetical protein